jgi:uncharacterized membrane protein YcaP (DUF421 family)
MFPPFDPNFWFAATMNPLEKIARPLLIYAFLLIAFRIFGKRQMGQLTPFDFIVLLTISNVVQNAMIGDDNSVGGGMLGASTILVANFALAYLTFKIPWLDRLVEGKSTTLVENGKILWKNLEKELLSEQDFRQCLARNGIDFDIDLPTLKRVQLDPDGQITILQKKSVSRKG